MRDAISKIQTQENYRANKLVSYTHTHTHTHTRGKEHSKKSRGNRRIEYKRLKIHVNLSQPVALFEC